MPGLGEIPKPALGVKNFFPDTRHGQNIVGWRQGRAVLFHQQPGDGGGVTQVDRQLQLRPAEERVLAGEATNQAGALGVERQVVVPLGAVARFGNAVEAMAAAVVQG